MPTQRLQDAILHASENASSLLIERGTTALTVAEIADGIGLSQRTFYRYFPTKEDAIRPLFIWGQQRIEHTVRARTDLDVRGALELGFAEAIGGTQLERTRKLVPLVIADPAFRAIYLQAFHDREESLAPILAERLGLIETSIRARMVAATAVTMMRVALELMVTTGDDPTELFAQALDEAESGLFAV